MNRYEPLENEIVRRARARCIEARAGQPRDNDAPYATHPEAVARILCERGVTDTAMLAAAYLHDVIEDTETSETALREEFGDEIVNLVIELTTDSKKRKRPFAEKHAYTNARVRGMSPRAKLIKLADRSHNLSECQTSWPEWKQMRYAKATLELLEAGRPWLDEGPADELRCLTWRILARLEPGVKVCEPFNPAAVEDRAFRPERFSENVRKAKERLAREKAAKPNPAADVGLGGQEAPEAVNERDVPDFVASLTWLGQRSRFQNGRVLHRRACGWTTWGPDGVV